MLQRSQILLQYISNVLYRTSVTFGETGGVFKKKFKKSSKVQKRWSGIYSPVTQYGSLWKGNFGGSIQDYHTCRYLNINQLKNPFQMNIMLISCPTYFTVSCRPNTLLMQAWSCVDFVLPKLFPRSYIVFELLWNGKWKITQYGNLWNGIFWGSI